MDLLSEIGDKDQLISAREENKVLRARVEELKEKVKALTVDNAALLAEVEMYRKKAALPTLSALSEIIDSENMTTDTKDDTGNSKREPKVLVHDLKSIPPYKKFRGAELVSAAGRYNQRLCSLCGGKKIRTYCICTPGTFRCRNCYDEHIIECNSEFATPA